jgi:hypothetical protein
MYKNRFEQAIKLAEEMTNLIYQRYEFSVYNRYQFFIGSANIGIQVWDIMKYKFALKILETNSTYLMIFGGSSVTAGYDNYFNQSHPLVFERRMKAVFNALGINLLVHNIAMSANSCHPYNFCYETQGYVK